MVSIFRHLDARRSLDGPDVSLDGAQDDPRKPVRNRFGRQIVFHTTSAGAAIRRSCRSDAIHHVPFRLNLVRYGLFSLVRSLLASTSARPRTGERPARMRGHGASILRPGPTPVATSQGRRTGAARNHGNPRPHRSLDLRLRSPASKNDIGLVMLTSGSSGPPKAAQLSWDALRASAEITQARCEVRIARLVPLPSGQPHRRTRVLLRAILSGRHAALGDADQLDDAAARGATTSRSFARSWPAMISAASEGPLGWCAARPQSCPRTW